MKRTVARQGRRATAGAPARRTARMAITLIEVTVALGLAAMLALAAQALVVHSYRTSATMESRDEATAAHALPFDLLRQDLDSLTMAGSIELRDGTLTISIVNALQSSRGGRRAVSVRYNTNETTEGLRLMRSERLTDDTGAWPAGIPLAEGLSRVEWHVFDGRGWETNWPQAVGRLARALRLRVQDRDGAVDERISRLTSLSWTRHDE